MIALSHRTTRNEMRRDRGSPTGQVQVGASQGKMMQNLQSREAGVDDARRDRLAPWTTGTSR
jgi:hypothetical protein